MQQIYLFSHNIFITFKIKRRSKKCKWLNTDLTESASTNKIHKSQLLLSYDAFSSNRYMYVMHGKIPTIQAEIHVNDSLTYLPMTEVTLQAIMHRISLGSV